MPAVTFEVTLICTKYLQIFKEIYQTEILQLLPELMYYHFGHSFQYIIRETLNVVFYIFCRAFRIHWPEVPGQ